MVRSTVLAALVTLGASPVLGRAQELGVMWRSRGQPALDIPVAVDLQLHRSRWIRQMQAWPEAAPPSRRSVVYWPKSFRQTDPAADLWQTYGEARNAPESVRTAAAVELGNEPDLHFSDALPDQFAAACKAAWHGLRRGRPALPVLMPALAAEPGPYATLLAQNGIARFTSAWNVHFYGWAQDYSAALATHRRFCAEAGGRHLPIWVTELGLADFPAAAPADELPFHLARQRTFFEAAAVAGRASGIAQQWAFCAGPYQFDGRDHGMHGEDQVARPAWDAWLQLATLLPAARPIYCLRSETDRTVRGWVFAVGSGTATRWWTFLMTSRRFRDVGLPEDCSGEVSPGRMTTIQSVDLRFPSEILPVRVGLDGSMAWEQPELHRTVSVTNNLHLWTPPFHFKVNGCRWEAVSPVNPTVPPDDGPGEVVLTLRPLGGHVRADKAAVAYRVSGSLPLGLEIAAYNFGTEAHRGAWRLHIPHEWRPMKAELDGRVTLQPGECRRWTNWVGLPAGLPSTRRSEVSAEWQEAAPSAGDRVVIRMATAGQPAWPAQSWGGDWEPVELASVWQRATSTNASLPAVWWCDGQPANPALILPVPAGTRIRPDDLLRLRLRLVRPPGHWVQARIDLVTPNRRVFQGPQLVALSSSWQTVEVRVGDASPAVWSHANADQTEQVRWVRLGFFGLEREERLELGDLQFFRGP